MLEGKPLADLTDEDLASFPVWEYDHDREAEPGRDETWITPVAGLPVTTLTNRVVAVPLRFGDFGTLGLLGNLDLDDPRSSREFLTLSVLRGGKWFDLARYFDADCDNRGPSQLAEFLGLAIDEAFPIEYDLSAVAVGHPEVLKGRIEAQPSERLTDASRLALIFGEAPDPA